VYARTATFEGVDPDHVAEEAKTIRSQMESGDGPPEGLEDAKGILMFLDRENRRSLITVLFDTEEGMRRGDEALNRMNPETGEGKRSSVGFYEVPLDLRR
jgi:hypothetical protein